MSISKLVRARRAIIVDRYQVGKTTKARHVTLDHQIRPIHKLDVGFWDGVIILSDAVMGVERERALLSHIGGA